MKRAVLAFILMLAACTGTSPEPDFYELKPVDGAAHPGENIALKIERPSIPAYLDRPDIVRQESAYQYKIDEFRRWTEPLDGMIARVLAEDLRQRLPDGVILTGADTGADDLRYAADTAIVQFNATGDGRVALKAVLTIRDKTGARTLAPQNIALSGETGSSTAALAAALSNLLAAYADRVVAVVKESQ
jgi:uncharacterized lipoprotein YmbA